jgi:hypothetical protein
MVVVRRFDRQMRPLRVFRALGRIAGRRRKSIVYNRLPRIAARMSNGPPVEGVGGCKLCFA